MPRPQFTLRSLLVVTLVVAAFFGAVAHLWPRVRVTVENTRLSQAHQVVLRAAGNSYPIGDLAPSELKELVLSPTVRGEIGWCLQVEFKDDDGTTFTSSHVFKADYKGTIFVSIKDGWPGAIAMPAF